LSAQQGLADLTSRELLAAYRVTQAQNALSELLQHHTSLVYGTCLRVLRNDPAAAADRLDQGGTGGGGAYRSGPSDGRGLRGTVGGQRLGDCDNRRNKEFAKQSKIFRLGIGNGPAGFKRREKMGDFKDQWIGTMGCLFFCLSSMAIRVYGQVFEGGI
jgi:hypothetical protein